MVHWLWVIAALIIGGNAGLLVTALLVAEREDEWKMLIDGKRALAYTAAIDEIKPIEKFV